jgi:N-acetylneuraminic acid mutarotase
LASFSIGSKVYVGIGYNDGDWPTRDFWEWDQLTNIWTRKADYPGNSTGYFVCFSIGTKGYIGTGNDFITNGFTNEFWEYNPATNSWTQKASLPTTPTRAFAVGFSIGTKGYIGLGMLDSFTAGDSPNPGYYQDFWEWDQATNVWTRKADYPGNSRTDAVGFSIGNKGYIGTGYGDGTFQRDFWEWDQGTNIWTKKADFGGIGRAGAVGFSIGNKGYIGTGSSDGIDHKDFWEWDQETNIWTKKMDFGGVARASAVGFSIGNKGYIGTGTHPGIVYASQDFWEYDPALK